MPLAAPRAAPDQTITRSFRAGLRTRAVFLRARRTRSSRRRRARRFLFSACRIGAPLELGRSGRAMMMVVPAPATGSSTTARPHPQHPNGCVYAVLSLPNFRLPRSWTLSLSAAARRTTPAASAASADSILVIAVGAIDGARASGADDDVGGRRRSQLRGRRLIAGLLRAAAGSTACSRSDICGWRSGVLYPLAGGDRESGAAQLDLQTDPQPPPGRCSGLRPHDGDVAGGAGFLCSDIRGRRWSSGDRATGSTAPTARIESRAAAGSTACSRSDICGWRSGVLYPLAGGDRESGAAQLDLQTDPQPPPGRCSGLRPHDGDVAGGAGFLCSDIRGRRWSSGDRATGSTAPTARIESRADWVYGVLSLRHLRLAIWCSLSLGGW